jgi:hypothetical protein
MMRPILAVVVALAIASPSIAATKFRCLTDGVKPAGKNFFVFHKSKKKRAKAVAMSESGDVSAGYPVGTVLQLFPFEAMIKRRKGFNPEGNDWEFFQLALEEKPNGKFKTRVVAQGKSEVGNLAGSCQGCHARLAPEHDLVCEFVIGAEGLGLTAEQIATAQANDPRCK